MASASFASLPLVILSFALSGPVSAATPPSIVAWETFDADDGLPSNKVFAVLVDGPRVWAGTDAGLAVLENGTVRVLGVDDGLPFPAVTALASAPNGDLWIGTMGGLARLSGGRIDSFDQLNSGLANDVIYGVAVDGDEVWVATAAGLSRFDTRTGQWSIFDTSNTLMHEPWTYAVTVEDGTVYVAVWGGGVIVRDPATGRFRQHRDPDGEMELDLFRDDGLVHDVTSAISVSEGVMWVGTYFGLSRYEGRRWRSFNQEDSGLAGDFINFVKARDGVVWIATDQGLSRFDDETWQTWREQPGNGFPSNTIFGIDLDRDDVWLATAAGLSHGIASVPTATTKEKNR